MNEELTDKSKPVTVGDLELWGGTLAFRITQLEEGQESLRAAVRNLKAGQERLERGLEAILEVINSIDQQLKELRDVPVRVQDLDDRLAILERRAGYPK